MTRATGRRPLTAYQGIGRTVALPKAVVAWLVAAVTVAWVALLGADSGAAAVPGPVADPSRAVAPHVSVPLAAAAFVDVPPGSAFFTEIQWMWGRGVTTGWPVAGGRDRPSIAVSREAMAAFMYRLAGSPAYRAPSRSPFRDVTPTNAFYKEICWLASKGISTGWILPDSREFRPLQPVSREAMAAFMYRLADSPNQAVTRSFLDVPVTSAFAREISWLAAAGISTGWPVAGGREYRPSANVSREAMAAFMYRLAATGRPLATRATVISAWLPYWTPTSSLTSVTRSLGVMDDVSPFWHWASGNGMPVWTSTSRTWR